MITVLGFYLVGDGISYVLNPRSRRVRTWANFHLLTFSTSPSPTPTAA
ncbi:MAG: hypothetical protein U0075_16640 [Thermomicrobiales bacterium]